MDVLLKGYRRFLTDVFPGLESHYAGLASAQAPQVLMITCADSRVVPNLIFGADAGELFIARNAGNVVPPPGGPEGGTTATIDYAVEVLGVRHAVVCGHSDCGAVRAAADPAATKDLPRVGAWLGYVRAAQAAAGELLNGPGEEASAEEQSRFRALLNIVGQLENLRAQPSVARAVAGGRLALHGWFYNIPRGSVEAFVERERRFLPLEEALA